MRLDLEFTRCKCRCVLNREDGLILGIVNIHFVHIESVELYLVELIIYVSLSCQTWEIHFFFSISIFSYRDSFCMILHIYL